MTLQQEYHQFTRYGKRSSNNHEKSVGGGNPLHKHQDYISQKDNVIPKRMNNTEKTREMRKIQSRRKEGSVLITDNPFN